MPRTTPTRVRAAIEVDASINVDAHIGTAHALTNYVAAGDSANLLGDDLLTEIETYLAAHYYALRDQQYESKQTGAASGKFQTGAKKQGLLATDWGQQAVQLDVTGQLAELGRGVHNVQLTWLGKPVNQQVDYWDRN